MCVCVCEAQSSMLSWWLLGHCCCRESWIHPPEGKRSWRFSLQPHRRQTSRSHRTGDDRNPRVTTQLSSIKILHLPINDDLSLHFGFAICCSPLNILTVLLSGCDRSLLYYSFICLTLFYVLYTTWKAPQVSSVYQMFYINNTALFKALKIMVVLKLH